MARNTTVKPAASAADDDKAKGDAAPLVEVTCLIAAGRRRGGRRWEAGLNRVAADALTDDEWSEVEADPMLSVSRPAAGE
ncbi:hypothetical protein [Paracoccus jiaweipingae]|uniref:hypothetical protein n=1 Tax=Paracoccus sp. p2-l61 TaxID=3366950 RepID=UPI003789737D